MNKNNFKPELLLPAGSIEAFYAAIEGGADAIYLGLKQFNARNRAKNFTWKNLPTIVDIAHEEKVKIYITLNTLIQNHEVRELIKTLHFLEQANVDAVIIQDLGVYYLIKKHFPKIHIHASTQMAVHNAAGANYFDKMQFERVILARELSLKEMELIANKSKIELEVFVHGALCYSFSGWCLFSSYLGSHSANRGMCTQPCRRTFDSKGKTKNFFSLKDNELIDFLPEMKNLNIASLKIEGRMKSADYVYNVAKAYRMAIDYPEKTAEAKKILDYDLGRDKTQWFKGNDIKNAITENTVTGKEVGKIVKIDAENFYFETTADFSQVKRIRLLDKGGKQQQNLKIKDPVIEGNIITIPLPDFKVNLDDKIFIASLKEHKFPSEVKMMNPANIADIPEKRIHAILRNLKPEKPRKQTRTFVRIDNADWLKKIHFDSIDGVIFNFERKDLESINFDAGFLKKNQHKIWIELPRFISETQSNEYRNIINSIFKKSYRQFFISHISQMEYIPKGAVVGTNEHVYSLNDFAVEYLRTNDVREYIFPLENGMENMISGNSRNGFVPMYYHPEVFYSRQPIASDDSIKDDEGRAYIKQIKNHMTVVVPEIPVSLLQYSKKLKENGFRNYLIDLSYTKASQNLFKKIQKRIRSSEQIQPSDNFNFKRGLK
jgi:U32 family peptidase